MSLTKRVGILTGAAVLTLCGVSFADAPQAADMNTQVRIAELESQVAQLRASQGDNWLTEQRASEIRGIVQDVLADADTRASLQGSGMTAGWDKANGFFLASSDGNFKLKIGGLLQFRWVYNNQEGSQNSANWNTMFNRATGNFGAFGAFNPDLTINGITTPLGTAFGTRVGLYNSTALMYALGFSEVERQTLLAPFTQDTDAVTPGVQIALAPGQIADLNATTFLFVHERIQSMSQAQRDAFAAALGQAFIVSSDGQIAGPVPGITNVNGQAISFGNFAEYEAFMQSLYNQQSLFNAGAGDEHRHGFDNRRTQLDFSGHVVNPQWQYYVRGDFQAAGGFFNLLDAYIRHDCGNGWSFKAGQFKAPLLREELVDDKYQQMIERSLVNSIFNVGRLQGLSVDYMGDFLHGTVMVSDGRVGLGTGITPSGTPQNTLWSTESVEGLALTGRLEWLAMGNWDQFQGLPSFQGDPTGILVGAAVHYQKEEYGTGDIAGGSAFLAGPTGFFNSQEIESVTLTADASIAFGGASLYGAFAYRHLNVDGPFIQQIIGGRQVFDQDQWGFLVQGGFFVTSDWEVVARFEYADGDYPDIAVGGIKFYEFDDLALLTVGVNKYFAGHQVKWGVDGGFAFDRVEFFASDITAGWRNDTGSDDDGQFVFRTQLQLYF